MRHLVRNGLILLVCLVLSIWAVVPPETKLRLGKDLAGGASITYGVTIRPGDSPDTMSKVIENIKERLDPKGIMDLQITAVGGDRLEITMPLPNDEVKRLRADFDAELAKLATGSLSVDELNRVLAMPGADRGKELARIAGSDSARLSRLEAAALAFDAYRPAREAYAKADKDYAAIKSQVAALEGKAEATDPVLEQLKASLKVAEDARRAQAAAVAPLEAALDSARSAAVTAGLNPGELARALQLSTERHRIIGKGGKVIEHDSPRERALKQFFETYKDQKPGIDSAIAKYEVYAAKRKALEDPQDIVRILKGAGVLSFRITINPNTTTQESEARQQLRTAGPNSVRVEGMRWYKINKIESWVNKEEQLEAFIKDATGFFAGMGYVVEEYKGEFYMLCADSRGLRLTSDDGSWNVRSASMGVDQYGRTAIDFQMDALGADRLGALTENNVNRQMAVLLDDQVYTAPRLNSRIANSGQISGTFTQPEIDYIVRVLSAGSLKNKLSEDPISVNVLGPQLGADNLRLGFKAGVAAFILVGIFMIGYYFSCGFISMCALVFNTLLVIAAMALNQAAFTLPGIAGIILTFGQAVDANVLVYERMREEFGRGSDMRNAIRLGYQRAMSAIIDGNVTTFIICAVLYAFGTQEIKGFALTLGLGTMTTLFAQLFGTRWLFTLLVEKFGWRSTKFLPMLANNWLGKRLIPNIDWMGMRFISYTITLVLLVMGVAFLFQGPKLLGTEFVGGTSVTLQFKDKGPDGKPVMMKRPDVEDIVRGLANGKSESDPLSNLKFAEVIAVNPDVKSGDSITSNQFTIKTRITDANAVQGPIIAAFADKIDTRQALSFTDHTRGVNSGAPVFPITAPTIGASIDRPEIKHPSGDFYGGVAIVMDAISPPVSKAELLGRITSARAKSDLSDTASRVTDVVITAGSEAAITGAVLIVRDPDITYFADESRWKADLAQREWGLISSSLTQAQTLASVQSFSSAVASSFANKAIISVVLSTLLVIIYIWLRFNSIRFSIAAILTTLHDCVVCIGFVGLATWLFNNVPALAGPLGILPFKIDLNVMTAIMTTLGFSLNDTIIVMDRIRENRGKLPSVTRKIINDSINQTVSRTLITSGTTFFAVITLYIFGGEAIRVFAYTMLIGVIVGTYSSIAVAAPLVWDRSPQDDKPNPKPNTGDAPNLSAVLPPVNG